MIYGRTGDVVTIVRRAVLADVQKLDGREPDHQDRQALKNGSYVVVRQRDGKERLYHQCYLRADRGSLEIGEALAAVEAAEPKPAAKTRHSWAKDRCTKCGITRHGYTGPRRFMNVAGPVEYRDADGVTLGRGRVPACAPRAKVSMVALHVEGTSKEVSDTMHRLAETFGGRK